MESAARWSVRFDAARLTAVVRAFLPHCQQPTRQPVLAAQVYDSGIPFSIVRLGAPPNDSAPAPGFVELTSAGGAGKSAQLSRSQVCRTSVARRLGRQKQD